MEFLPYPLPSKIRLLLNKIRNQNGKTLILSNYPQYISQQYYDYTVQHVPDFIFNANLIFYFILGKPTQEDRFLFCEIHHAETTIVPDGIQKGYPIEINFGLLKTQII